MTRLQRELNEAANRMDALIVKVAVIVLAGLFIMQLMGK